MGAVVCKRPTPFAHCCLNGGNFFSVGDSLTNQGIARKNTVEEKKVQQMGLWARSPIFGKSQPLLSNNSQALEKGSLGCLLGDFH